jgi:hypothetical protein
MAIRARVKNATCALFEVNANASPPVNIVEKAFSALIREPVKCLHPRACSMMIKRNERKQRTATCLQTFCFVGLLSVFRLQIQTLYQKTNFQNE